MLTKYIRSEHSDINTTKVLQIPQALYLHAYLDYVIFHGLIDTKDVFTTLSKIYGRILCGNS